MRRPRSLISDPPGVHGWAAAFLLSATIGLGAFGCSGEGCPTCIEGVDPGKLIDPLTLGDGSGFPGASWVHAPKPELLGWSDMRLKSVRELAQHLGSDGLVVVDRGVVVLEYGSISRNLIVQSCRKSFLAGLYGIYHAQGLIDLDATMGELGIDDLPPVLTTEEKQATVEQLLKARSGVYHEAAAESQSMKNARPERGSHPPGTFWYYNNWDFNVLGTLFTQFTGKGVFEGLYRDLALPLQMQEFRPSNGVYQYEEMSEHPAYHFSMSPRDLARYGLLILREGRWRDVQIIPESWVARMLLPYSDAGSTWAYGYMWWIGKPQAWGGHTVYAARGGSGQAIYVIPDMQIVITHKVDNSRWSEGWSDVNNMVRVILDAKVL